MERRNSVVVGAVALLLVGGLALLLRERGSSSNDPEGRARTESEAPPTLAADGDRPVLEAANADGLRAGVPTLSPGADGAAASSKEEGAEDTNLRVRLEVPPGFAAWPVRVQVTGRIDADPTRGPYVWHAATSAEVDVPIERIVRREGVSYLVVELRHPDLLDTSEIVPMDERQRGVTLRLRPAHIVTARLLRPDGEPLNGGASLHRTGPDAPMHDDRRRWSPHHVAKDNADAAGGVRLRVPEPGRYLLVVERRGMEPWARMVDVPETGALALGDLVIGYGARLRGRVTLGGRGIGDAWVRAKPVSEAPAFYAIGQVFRWDGQRLSSHLGVGHTDGEGRFEMVGLSPGPYEVEVTSWDPILDLRPTQRVSRMQHTVTAPDDAVEVAVRGFALTVEVRVGDRRAQGNVSLYSASGGAVEDSASVDTDTEGRARFLVVPGLAYRVRVSRQGHPDGTAETTAGAIGGSGSVIVVLGPERARGRLRVHLTDEQGAPIDLATLRLVDGDAVLEQGGRSTVTGVHEVWGLDVGTWDLTVFPGAAHDDDATAFYLPLKAHVEVAAGDPTDVRLTARRGGRLLLNVRDGDGRHLPAAVIVRDAETREVPLRYRIEKVDGGWQNGATAPDGTGIALSLDVLAPGTYEVRVEPKGKDPVTRSVTIEPGRTARVDVVVR